MKCKKCKFAKFFENKKMLQCLLPIPEQKTQCILRNLFWLILSNQSLAKKTEKLIDKTIDEIDEGEKWKKP